MPSCFLAGVSCFTVYIFKALAIYFLPGPVVSFVILWITMKTADERKRLLKSAGMFLAGMAATVMLWYVTFFAPNYEAIDGIGAFITSLSLPHSFRQFFQDILATPYFSQCSSGHQLFLPYLSSICLFLCIFCFIVASR